VRADSGERPLRVHIAGRHRRTGSQSHEAQLIGDGDDRNTEMRFWARLETDEKPMKHIYPRLAAHPSLSGVTSGAKLPFAWHYIRCLGVNKLQAM
jgi:hypothetical protein